MLYFVYRLHFPCSFYKHNFPFFSVLRLFQIWRSIQEIIPRIYIFFNYFSKYMIWRSTHFHKKFLKLKTNILLYIFAGNTWFSYICYHQFCFVCYRYQQTVKFFELLTLIQPYFWQVTQINRPSNYLCHFKFNLNEEELGL